MFKVGQIWAIKVGQKSAGFKVLNISTSVRDVTVTVAEFQQIKNPRDRLIISYFNNFISKPGKWRDSYTLIEDVP